MTLSKEFRARSEESFLPSAYAEVRSRLNNRLNPEVKDELDSLIPIAIPMLQQIGASENFYHTYPTYFNELLVLTCGVASAWQRANSLKEQRMAHVELHKLWAKPSTRIKNYQHDAILGNTSKDRMMKQLLAYYYPASNGESSWIKRHYADERGVVIIEGSAVKFLLLNFIAIVRENVNLLDPRANFGSGGWTDFENDVAFVHAKAPKDIRVHEELHLKSFGFWWGALGSALDEGMTNLIARDVTYGDMHYLKKLIPMGYSREMRMIEKLSKNDPELRSVLEQRYAFFGKQISLDFLTAMLNRFGVDGFFKLVSMSPGNCS